MEIRIIPCKLSATYYGEVCDFGIIYRGVFLALLMSREWDEDEDLDENGDTEEESMRRQEYMEENFPNAGLEESLSDTDKLALMEANECSECGGTIETELDTSEENLIGCSSCGKEHVHCSSCSSYYDAFLMECPNDHS
tara:strand:- start:596 stop:1012 length:417 start_codon:yes stop_codon:yes gene_type:complete